MFDVGSLLVLKLVITLQRVWDKFFKFVSNSLTSLNVFSSVNYAILRSFHEIT